MPQGGWIPDQVGNDTGLAGIIKQARPLLAVGLLFNKTSKAYVRRTGLLTYSGII